MSKRNVAGTVADPTIEFVPITIKGREYSLCWDFSAICEAEKLTGCNLLQGIAGVMLHTMTAAQFRGLLYAAMLKAQPNTTLLDAGSLLSIESMSDIREALLKAYGVSMPEKPKDPPEPGAPGENESDRLPTDNSGTAAGLKPECSSDSPQKSSSTSPPDSSIS
jgi:hypothetical protein